MVAFESLSQTIHTKKKNFFIDFVYFLLFSPHKHSALRTPLSPVLPFH